MPRLLPSTSTSTSRGNPGAPRRARTLVAFLRLMRTRRTRATLALLTAVLVGACTAPDPEPAPPDAPAAAGDTAPPPPAAPAPAAPLDPGPAAPPVGRLDVAGLPPAERAAAIASRIDALGPVVAHVRARAAEVAPERAALR